MRLSFSITLFGIFSYAVAQKAVCKPSEKFIKLPTEATSDFAAAMIVNSLYKGESKLKIRAPRTRSSGSISSAKFYKRAPQAKSSPAPIDPVCNEQGCSSWAEGSSSIELAEYGGNYPADDKTWLQVDPQLFKDYLKWCAMTGYRSRGTDLHPNANKMMKLLCTEALGSIIEDQARSTVRTATGQTNTYPGTPEYQHFLDFSKTFGADMPQLVEPSRILEDTLQASAQSIPSPLPPSPSDPPHINRPLMNWLNNYCAWAPFCRPNRYGQFLRCVGSCGLDMENSEDHPNPTAVTNRVVATTLWSVAASFLVFFAILGGDIYAANRNSKPPRDKSAGFTNIRIEFPRGGAPRDVKQVDLNETPSIDIITILEKGWQPPPGWNQMYDDGRPEKKDEHHAANSRGLMQRDDLEDHSCIPDSGDDLEKLIYNLWFTQFKPAVEAGQSESMEFSAFHEEFGGPDQIHKGGQFVVKIWISEKPDWAGLGDPNVENYDSYDFPDEDKAIRSLKDYGYTQGIECFTDARPVGSFNNKEKAGWPRTDWHYSVTDACYQAWGKSGEAPHPTTGFTYQGRGKNWDKDDSTDGLGWGLRYKPLGNCQRTLKCQDFTGLHFDAQDNGHKEGGDLNNLYTTCTQPKVNPDGLFRGGRIYHQGRHGNRWGKYRKRDAWDPDHPDDPFIFDRCGETEIWPLLDDVEVTTNPDGSDNIIKGFSTR